MQYNHNTCPECRSTIELRQLVAIVKDKNDEEQASGTSSLASSVSSLNSDTSDTADSTNSVPTTSRPFATSSNNNTRQNLRQTQRQIFSKEDTLVNIIQANPEGKFVVFSKLDSSYWGCMNRLRTENVSYSLLRGNSNVMSSVLEHFKNGNTRVLLLNTVHAASGIDISCATDLILVHDLGHGRTQAVGRCNRHPRNTSLRIHQLCYPHEINS
jgi:superfamily II DNA/RNA helicase